MVRRPNSPVRNHRSRSKSAVRSQRSLSVSRHQTSDTQLEEACLHKRHDTLEWLKTFNVSGNQLNLFQVCINGKILFPGLTTLDLSYNNLKMVPSNLSRISGLSVLNLSDNKDIHELPPELGMLSRLWSLSVKGCQLKDPLDSMVNMENCKTVEIVAYLKTILEESKTYRHLRLLILGEDGVGKSLLWESLRGEAIQKRHASQTENVRIAEWKFEAKRSKGETSSGPVGFTAWDFCGQVRVHSKSSFREYYSTHQYFLTRRTLYIVVWRVTDDEMALTNTRAPNASVILVATHVDHVSSNPNKFPSGFLENVEAKVKSRFMISDADKRGLPRVIDLLFVSTKSKHDIKMLLSVIYKCAWEVRIGKERALDQQIPSSYVALMKVYNSNSDKLIGFSYVRFLNFYFSRTLISITFLFKVSRVGFRKSRSSSLIHSFLRISTDDVNVSVEKIMPPRCADIILTFAYNKVHQLRRIYVMSYIPTGFWSRLITRIIGDQNVSQAIEEIFIAQSKQNITLLKDISNGHLKAEWMIWQTGIEMLVKGHSLFVLKQFFSQVINSMSYVLLLPFTICLIYIKKIVMQTDMEGASRLLALVVDLVDTLLEDWYPSLGTRFVHTSEGDLLVNRFVPCSHCASLAGSIERRSYDDADIDTRNDSSSNVRGSKTMGDIRSMRIVHCFSIEECMLAGREFGWLECPSHGGVHMRDIAPDTVVFLDIEGSLQITGENIRRGRMLGRGAFGFVFRANIRMMVC
uniref:Roc domain-containing protein n=1 Tax=Heterorhabditis bacteriophora TaxID=37862 RepID=A0A1I7XMP7_HETBA